MGTQEATTIRCTRCGGVVLAREGAVRVAEGELTVALREHDAARHPVPQQRQR